MEREGPLMDDFDKEVEKEVFKVRLKWIAGLLLAFIGLLALAGHIHTGVMAVILLAALVGGVLLRFIFPKG